MARMVVLVHRKILRTLRRSQKSHKRSAKETRHCNSGHTERPQRLGTSHAQGSRTLAKERRPLQVIGEP
ncbi:rho guanine nucleotide exchange factor 10 isoform A [Sesbania bispinosa]|nr:rho guanine nucleotide exchange factor 10 isoform A [Sesbania bispinosa]